METWQLDSRLIEAEQLIKVLTKAVEKLTEDVANLERELLKAKFDLAFNAPDPMGTGR